MRISLLATVFLLALAGPAYGQSFSSSSSFLSPAGSAAFAHPLLQAPVQISLFQSTPPRSNFPTTLGDSSDPPVGTFQVNDKTCTPERPHAKACKLKVRDALVQSFMFLSIESSVNVAMNPVAQRQLANSFSQGEFWYNYWRSVERFRFGVYNDDDSIKTTYVGHPMMGAIVEYIWLQNDPKYRGLEQQNSKAYWRSRLWAMIPSAIYSAQWLLGPVSEASMGDNGFGYWHDPSHNNAWTNGTGNCDLFITPLGGFLWTVGEDWLDLHVGRKLRMRTRNRGLLLISALVTPDKSGANILRFKAPWYRDSER